jgi:hypothetical protein
MNEITTLFTTIGEFFTKSAWYSMVKLPFWTLLFTVAAGGVYCARFGKKTLLNQGISSTLCIVTVYLSTMLLCLYIPSLRTVLKLPFLTMTAETATLVDPFTMTAPTAAPILLRLMMLVFLINTADSFGAGGKSLPTWILTEALAMVIALLFYWLLGTGVQAVIPWLLGKYSIVPVVGIIALALVIICAKFIFTKVITKENKYYAGMNKFFTTNRMGTLLTTSALSFLLCTLLSLVLHVRGENVLTFASVNRIGLWLILAMVLLVQFIFEMYYQDRKKG